MENLVDQLMRPGLTVSEFDDMIHENIFENLGDANGDEDEGLIDRTYLTKQDIAGNDGSATGKEQNIFKSNPKGPRKKLQKHFPKNFR